MFAFTEIPFFDLGQIGYLLALIFGVLIFALIDFVFYFFLKNKPLLIALILGELILVAAWGFGLFLLTVAGIIYVASFLTVSLVAENAKIKTVCSLIASKKLPFKKDKIKPESLFDREEVYGKVMNAVVSLSKTKTGALITFEKTDKLDEYIKSGTVLQSPVVPELLQTIFYTGTRLHDGAVVIRNDEIYAASVYYTPTTRPLTGKYGSRHRAAIGISETTDSVTIVVSEETGRISIAYDGELQSVGPESLLSTFLDYMAMEKKTPQDN